LKSKDEIKLCYFKIPSKFTLYKLNIFILLLLFLQSCTGEDRNKLDLGLKLGNELEELIASLEINALNQLFDYEKIFYQIARTSNLDASEMEYI